MNKNFDAIPDKVFITPSYKKSMRKYQFPILLFKLKSHFLVLQIFFYNFLLPAESEGHFYNRLNKIRCTVYIYNNKILLLRHSNNFSNSRNIYNFCRSVFQTKLHLPADTPKRFQFRGENFGPLKPS